MLETPKEVVQSWFDRVWNAGEEAAIDELLSPNGIAHGLPSPDGSPIVGPAGFKPFFRTFKTALPNIKVTIRQCVTEGDLCAVYCEVSGTHSGDSLGPATNRQTSFTGMTLVRVKDGQIQEGWNSYDFLTMYQQLGLTALIG